MRRTSFRGTTVAGILRARHPSITTSLAMAIAVALAIPGMAFSRDLPPIDALAGQAPQPTRGDAAQALARDHNVTALVDPRLGLPTFVWSRPGARGGENSARQLVPDVAARTHLKSLAGLYRARPQHVDGLESLDQTRLPNDATLVRLRNQVDGVEVFREQVAVLLDRRQELVAVGGTFSAGADAPLAKSGALFTLSAQEAVARALADYDFAANAVAAALTVVDQRDGYQFFDFIVASASATGALLSQPARSKRVYFRLPDGLVPAWYVEVQVADSPEASADYYAYVISARNGEVLFRHNQTSHYDYNFRVWAETSGAFRPLPGPHGDIATPHPTGLPDGYQAPFVAPNLVTLQNGPISTNDPWLPFAAVQTLGNNVDAYVDAAAPDGFSNGDLRATTTSGSDTFDRVMDPNLAPNANDTQRMAAVTSLFFVNNWLHDWFYDAGFDEAAGNAQASNYGRGGAAGDVLRAEAQDYSGRNNANMSTPADGLSPRMQMYIFDRTLGDAQASASGGLVANLSPLGIATTFGPESFNLSANLILAEDPAVAGSVTTTDACSPITNNITGSIALVDRGSCTFPVKAANVQAAGGIGMLLANDRPGPPAVSNMGGTDPSITISSLMVSQAAGVSLKAALLGGPVTVNMLRTPSVDRDGTVDNLIVAHEWGHYISNRLVQNASGLSNQVGRGMGEGWADFHALLMMVREGDDLEGAYGAGSFALSGNVPAGSLNNNYYFGIRRFPYSIDRAKNDLRFRHIQNGVALPATPASPNANANSQVHNTGEVWSSMLFECYAALLNDGGRLSFAEAQDRMKRYLVAGYKLTPAAPTFVEARDGILAAMLASDYADFEACGLAFASRGLGSGAVAPDRFSTTNIAVTESYAFGEQVQVVSAAISDLPATCDADSILDNGEQGTLTVSVRNAGFTSLSQTVATLSSTDPGVSFPDGAQLAIPASQPLQTVTATTRIALSGLTGSPVLPVSVAVADGAATSNLQIEFWANRDEVPANSATDSVEGRTLRWTPVLQGYTDPATRWSRLALAADSHVLRGPDVAAAGVTWLQSPPLQVAANGNFTIGFRHRFSLEWDNAANWDGAVIEISTNNGQTWSDLGASLYNGAITVTGGNNPLEGRPGFVRQSAGYPAFIDASIDAGSAYAGQTVLVRFGVGGDSAVGATGWDLDDISFGGISNTPFDSVVAHRGVCGTLNAVVGDLQSTPVNTRFPSPLRARLLDNQGFARSGQTVTFTAPTSGASAILGSEGKSVAITTDAQGFASIDAFANGIAGSYQVVASNGQQSATFNLSNGSPVTGSAPDLAGDTDSGLSDSDNITNAPTPAFVGSCVSGDVVQLQVGGSDQGNPVVCVGNAYRATVALAEGSHAVRATFRRGDTLSTPTAALNVQVDRTAPGAPTFAAIGPAGSRQQNASGSGEAGMRLMLRDGAATRCATTVAGDASWSCMAQFPGTGTYTLHAVQVDVAGNESLGSTALPATVTGVVFASSFED